MTETASRQLSAPVGNFRRTRDLLAAYHPIWRIDWSGGNDPASGIAQATSPTAWIGLGPDGALVMAATAPRHHVGSLDSGVGLRQADFPAALWPLQVAMALASRLDLLGLRTRLAWPSTLLRDGVKIGSVRCAISGDWLRVHASVELPGAIDMMPSLVQGVLTVIESPWRRDLLLRYYNEWCVLHDEPEGGIIALDGDLLLMRLANGGAIPLDSGCAYNE